MCTGITNFTIFAIYIWVYLILCKVPLQSWNLFELNIVWKFRSHAKKASDIHQDKKVVKEKCFIKTFSFFLALYWTLFLFIYLSFSCFYLSFFLSLFVFVFVFVFFFSVFLFSFYLPFFFYSCNFLFCVWYIVPPS